MMLFNMDSGLLECERTVPAIVRPHNRFQTSTGAITVSLWNASSWLFSKMNRLDVIKSSLVNWSEDFEAPSDLAIKNARRWLVELSQFQFEPDYVGPTTGEGIVIGFGGGGPRLADIECFNDGEMLASIDLRYDLEYDGEIWTAELEKSEATIEKIREFMCGQKNQRSRTGYNRTASVLSSGQELTAHR